MKYAVISDLHANVWATRKVLSDAKEMGAESIVCLGDVVGYGPAAKETMELVRSGGERWLTVAGNHDDAVSARIDTEDFVDLAAEMVARHRAELDQEDINWLKALPYAAEIDGALIAHGDFVSPESFAYIDTDEAAAANFAANDAPLMFVGHTHVPHIYVIGESGKVHAVKPTDFRLEEDKRYIVNVGSVGYPREENGVCLSSYVIYDSSQRTIQFRRLPFSVASVMGGGKGTIENKPNRPRAKVWRILSLVLGAGVLAALIALGVQMSQHQPQVVEERQVHQCTMARELDLSGNEKWVKANLKLKKKSAPAELSVEFLDAAGKRLKGSKRWTVVESAGQRIKVPQGAKKARFEIFGKADVLRFSPEEGLTTEGAQ